MKKVLFFCLCSFLSYQLLAQPFQKKQITNFDYDSRGALIPSYPLGLSFRQSSPIFYEAHQENAVNIIMLSYDSGADSFFNPTELTKNNFQNINADANGDGEYSSNKINLVWQTNENGNWDIALKTLTDSTWSSKRYIANSLSNETNPKFVARHRHPYPTEYEIEVLYEKENSIYLYQQLDSIIINELIFSGDNSNKFSQPTGVYYNGLYVVAVYKPSDTTSIIVYRYKAYNDSAWSPIQIAYDSGYCVNPNFYNLYSEECPLSFEKVIDGKKEVFLLPSVSYLGQNSRAVKLLDNSLASTSDLKMFHYGIVGKNENYEDYDLWGPHTYKLISNDSSYVVYHPYFGIGSFYFHTKVLNSRIGLGNLGIGSLGYAVSYTVWEDSSNGRINLFGIARYDALGDIDDKLVTNNFQLYQNYPNPFNPKTMIKFILLSRDYVTLKVFDVLGNEIAALVNEEKESGEYKTVFDASGIASGIYVYRLTVGKNYLTRKMILLK